MLFLFLLRRLLIHCSGFVHFHCFGEGNFEMLLLAGFFARRTSPPLPHMHPLVLVLGRTGLGGSGGGSTRGRCAFVTKLKDCLLPLLAELGRLVRHPRAQTNLTRLLLISPPASGFRNEISVQIRKSTTAAAAIFQTLNCALAFDCGTLRNRQDPKESSCHV